MDTTFAALMERPVTEAGGEQPLADRIGVSRSAVKEWRRGRVPYVATLIRLADTCDLDRGTVLALAGKPPLEQLRELLAVNPETTLAIRLCRFRTDNGYDTEAAAAAIGMDRWQFSCYANGSLEVKTLAKADIFARALGTDVVDICIAAGCARDGDLVAAAVEATNGFAAYLRRFAAAAGYKTFENGDIRLLAGRLQLTVFATKEMLAGHRLPDFVAAQKIARFAGVELHEVLVAAGWDRSFAEKLANKAEEAKQLPRVFETTGAIVRAHRIVAGLSAAALARSVGVDHSAVSRWEHDHRTPSVEHLAAVADRTGAPLERLLRSAALVA